jgi:UDP-N-acetyl-D-glucosamine dehydrogenase
MKFVPSIGVGGHCIPVDPEYFTNFAQSQGMSTPLTSAANRINSDRPNLVVDMIRKYLGAKISGLSVQLAGIAYKSDVPDIRESPALELIQALRRCGAKVSWHDPLVEVWQEERSTPIDPAVNLGLVVTPHSKIDFSPWITSRTLVLDLSVDNRNLGWPRIL